MSGQIKQERWGRSKGLKGEIEVTCRARLWVGREREQNVSEFQSRGVSVEKKSDGRKVW